MRQKFPKKVVLREKGSYKGYFMSQKVLEGFNHVTESSYKDMDIHIRQKVPSQVVTREKRTYKVL